MNDVVVPENPRSVSPTAQGFDLVSRPLPVLGVPWKKFQADIPWPDTFWTQFEADESVQTRTDLNVLFAAGSLYEFNIDKRTSKAGYPYLTYVVGEVRLQKLSISRTS